MTNGLYIGRYRLFFCMDSSSFDPIGNRFIKETKHSGNSPHVNSKSIVCAEKRETAKKGGIKMRISGKVFKNRKRGNQETKA